MDYQQFLRKWGLTDEDDMVDWLDSLYLEFTKEQVIGIVSDYYDNADDIYNSMPGPDPDDKPW